MRAQGDREYPLLYLVKMMAATAVAVGRCECGSSLRAYRMVVPITSGIAESLGQLVFLEEKTRLQK